MTRMLLCPAILSLALALTACGGLPDGEQTDELTPVEDGKLDSASERQVTASGTTLWVDTWLSRVVRQGQERLLLEGRTSRNLTGGFAFICDDAFGGFAQLSTRRFEVTWPLDETVGLMNGVDQFVRLDFKTTKSLSGHVVVRPRLKSFSGSGMYLKSDARPVIVGGRTVYRVEGTATSKIYGLTVRAGETDLRYLPVTRIDDTHFHVDLERDQVLALAGAATELIFDVRLLAAPETKRARLGVATIAVGLTSADPYQIWPGPTCKASTKACLKALPAGTLDLAACGEARTVQACQAQVGLTVQQAELQAATSRADALLAGSPGFAADASALVGADRAAALAKATRAAVVDQLETHRWRWYLDATALAADLDATIAAVIDESYATPLQLVTPLAPLPGDLARTRQVVADALLAYLASVDLVATEFGRPLATLARVYRAKHVTSLRDLRETSAPTVVGTAVHYLGNWLGAYVEVAVDPATGKATKVYFEID